MILAKFNLNAQLELIVHLLVYRPILNAFVAEKVNTVLEVISLLLEIVQLDIIVL